MRHGVVVMVRYVLVASILLACSASAHASVIFYTSQAAFDAAASPTLIEDFETGITKDTILATLTHNGITYTPFDGSPSPNVFVASPGYTNFGAGVTQPTTTSILTASGNEDFSAAFTTSYLAVGFDTYLNGLGDVSVQFFNGATLLGTFTYLSGNDMEYLGIVSTTPITSFRWTAAQGGELNTGIDNISVSNSLSSVPEPSAMLLLGSGLLGILARRKLNIGLK
jgi:hypothetical protein